MINVVGQQQVVDLSRLAQIVKWNLTQLILPLAVELFQPRRAVGRIGHVVFALQIAAISGVIDDHVAQNLTRRDPRQQLPLPRSSQRERSSDLTE